MVDELASIPLEIRDVMLFDDEVAPVRGSAGKDNPRARISGEDFRRLLHAKQEYPIVASSHLFDDLEAKKVQLQLAEKHLLPLTIVGIVLSA